MYEYPITLTPDDNGTVMLTVPDVPEVTTWGETPGEAIASARDALETALSAYITDRRDIPTASEFFGNPVVAPSLLGRLKLDVYRAMRERGWRKADLAREMKANPRQIDRLLDLLHGSTVEQLEQALAVFGLYHTTEVRHIAGLGEREVHVRIGA